MATLQLATDPAARQLGILARAFMKLGSRQALGAQVAGMTLLLLLSPVIAGRRPGVLEAIGWLAVAAITYASVSVGLMEALRPARERAGFESFLWIGRWEYRQALAAVGERRLPSSPDAARRWLVEHPTTAPQSALRIELLVWTSDFSAASDVVDGLPGETSWQRFQKELHRAFVAFVATGGETLGGARFAANELSGTERARADAMIAVEEARHRVAAADTDWIAPLVDPQRCWRAGPLEPSRAGPSGPRHGRCAAGRRWYLPSSRSS